ncbi:hypothetical protein CIHG_06547 [Coccidioides immitis H538.4]|uniref:Uncharacterized protein n=3 Tax=Coccidioides immitis TaxID=5501 RepID=A0A0J8QJ15_COCIT|nr:hypothetical protein CIRG_07959 [Coccidioides immitis RMSCC 2394]KMU72461.1 hypothetical protein CISG_03109 [Coccidioides immitis RMSCC 3703]KMU88609.1 hypothetical protein CIHG_06547 [Coccidioides immitis H538.4]
MWHPVLRFSTRCLTARFVLRLALTNLVAGRTLDIFEEAGHEGISSCLIVAVRLVSSDSTQDPESFVYDGRGVSIASLYGVLRPRNNSSCINLYRLLGFAVPVEFIFDGTLLVLSLLRGCSLLSITYVARSRRAGRIVWNGLHHRVKDVIDVVTPHPMQLCESTLNLCAWLPTGLGGNPALKGWAI